MFAGYSPETIDFLWGIRMNNNREWFTEHKKDYVKYLYEPTKALGQELFQPFLDRPGNILKVSRIYRDARMRPTTPYKESLWICIRQDVEWWAENPCLYFDINPDGISYGFSLWRPRTGTMEAFRRRITAEPEEFLELIRSTERVVGMSVSADCYKRPKPTENPDLVPYFAWKSDIGCIRSREPGPDIFGPELKDEVLDFFENLIPLYEYFNQFKV